MLSSGICMILSILLVILATVNIFPVKRPLNRLLFLIIFSFTATEALLGWSYPLSLSNDSPKHNVFQFPFIHTFFLVILTTSAALHSTLPRTTDLAEKIYFAVIAWVVMGLIWCIVFDLREQIDGIFWSCILTSSLIAISTRIAQVLRHVRSTVKNTRNSSPSTTVCGLCAVVSVLSAIGLSLLGHHQVSIDFLVPISSSIFLTTRRDLFIVGNVLYYDVSMKNLFIFPCLS